MADHTDGRIVIDTLIDTKSFENELKKMRDAAKKATTGTEKSVDDGVTTGAKQAEKAVGRIGTTADKTKKKLKDVGTAGKDAGPKASSGMKALKDAADQTEARVAGLKSALGKIAKVIGVAAIARKLVGLGAEAVALGSNIAEVQNVVDTAFGSMSDKIEAFAETSIQQYGMSKLAAKQTASTYMAMARGMGIAEDAASDMSVALTGLSGDVASFYNISQEEADTKLKSIFTGETETLKSLGVVMTQTNLDAYALANGFGKTTDKMTQAELVALRYAYVTNQLGMAQGDFAKTSGSWANQTRILSENWKEFLSIMGQGLIQALTPAIQLLNQLMSYLIAAANTFSAFMSKLFGTEAIQAQQEQAKAIGAAASAENDLAQNTKKAAAEAKRATASFDEMTILQDNQTASGTGTAGSAAGITVPGVSVAPSAAPDVPLVAQAIEKIKALFDGLKTDILTKYAPSITAWGDAFAGLKAPVSDAFSSVQESVSGLWNNTLVPAWDYLMGTWAPDIVNTFSTTVAPVFSDVLGWAIQECAADFSFLCDQVSKLTRDIFLPCMETIRKISADMGASVKSTWADVGGTILAKASEMRAGLREIWNAVYDRVIKPVVDRVAEVVNWLWDKHLKKLWDNTVQFFASVTDCVLTIWNRGIKPFVDYLVAYLAPIVTSVINTIVDVVGTIIATVSDVLSGVIEALTGIIDFITGVFSGDWEKAWDGIKKYYTGIWDAIYGVVKGVINLIIDALNALWRGLYSAVAGVINGVGSIVKSFGKLLGKDWGFKVPSQPPVIPKLAQGAVIPPNRQFMAVLGDQQNGRNLEAPESLIRQIVREESGGSDRPLTLVLKIGNKRFGSVVLESLRELEKQNGSLELALT